MPATVLSELTDNQYAIYLYSQNENLDISSLLLFARQPNIDYCRCSRWLVNDSEGRTVFVPRKLFSPSAGLGITLHLESRSVCRWLLNHWLGPLGLLVLLEMANWWEDVGPSFSRCSSLPLRLSDLPSFHPDRIWHKMWESRRTASLVDYLSTWTFSALLLRKIYRDSVITGSIKAAQVPKELRTRLFNTSSSFIWLSSGRVELTGIVP
jgi:hypothetical protein